MQVNYHLEWEDYQEVLSQFPWWRRWKKIVWLTVAGVAPGTIFLAALRDIVALAIAGLFVTLFLTHVIRNILANKRVTWRDRPNVSQVILPNSMHQQTEHCVDRWHASVMTDVLSYRSHLAIETLGEHLLLIPKQAFDTPAAADEYEDAARSVMENYRGRDPMPDDFSHWEPQPPSDDGIFIEYTNKPQHFDQATTLLHNKSGSEVRALSPVRVWLGRLLWLTLTAGFYLGAIYAAVPWESTFMACFAFFSMFLGAIVAVGARMQRQSFQPHCRPWRVSITTTGLSWSSSQVDCHCDWKAIKSVLRSKGVIAIFGETNNLRVAIPIDAFPNPEAALRFYTQALDYLETANPNKKRSDSLPPIVETGNPYQPPVV